MVPITSTSGGADILAPGLGVACAQGTHHEPSWKTTLGCRRAEETGGSGEGWTGGEAGLLSGDGEVLDIIV